MWVGGLRGNVFMLVVGVMLEGRCLLLLLDGGSELLEVVVVVVVECVLDL